MNNKATENPYIQTINTKVAYRGDVANQPGIGAITAVRNEGWETAYEITLAAEPSPFGEECSLPERRMWISDSAFAGPDALFILSPEQAGQMNTEIRSNGSKWLGEAPDSIGKLIEVLGEYTLDEENFNGFIHWNEDGIHFFGNFAGVSHVFSIISDDPGVIAPLTAAIVRNVRLQHPGWDESESLHS